MTALARKVGLSAPETRSIPKPNVMPDSDLARFTFDDDAWSVQQKMPGRSMVEADWKNPQVATQLVNDRIFGYATGNVDRNENNTLIDGDRVHSLDMDSQPIHAGSDEVAHSGLFDDVPDGLLLDTAFLSKLRASSKEIESIGGEGGRDRAAVVDALAKMDRPTTTDLKRISVPGARREADRAKVAKTEEKAKEAKAKESHEMTAGDVMAKIKASPQFQDREVDWDRYAERSAMRHGTPRKLRGSTSRVILSPEKWTLTY